MIDDKFYLSEEEREDAYKDDANLLNDEFLFDKKNFNTIIIQQKKENDNQSTSLRQILDVEKFIQQYQNSQEKNDLLLWLKQNNYRELLIEQIQQIQDASILSQLICAYWEAGFNDSNDLPVFIPHLLSSHFSVVLETSSAITALSRPFHQSHIKKAIADIQKVYTQLQPENIPFVDEVLELLKKEWQDIEEKN